MKDSKFSAVIFTAGRSGSHLIRENLSKYFRSDQVIHTHNPLLKLPTANTIPVISRRKNMFDAIISMTVASRIDKFHWTHQDAPINIDPFSIDPVDFENAFIFHTAFNRAIDARKFTNSIEIFYEDMLDDSAHLFSKFQCSQTMENLFIKSPYESNSLVINIDQLKNLYNQLDTAGISDDVYGYFIANVSNDLVDIKENHNGNRYRDKISNK
jgi:hypothetical protein